MSEELSPANEIEALAWAVLRAANRTQARGTTVRLVVPRAPEVAHDLDLEDVAEVRIVAAEEWLLERGYLAPSDVGLTRGAYTITPAGLEWLRGGMPEPREAPQKATEPETGHRPHPSAEENSEGRRWSWWNRWFGG